MMAPGLLKSLMFGKKDRVSKNNDNNNEKQFQSKRLFALKESRWFRREEFNLFKNVLDSGYILELRIASENNGRNTNKDSVATLEYGIVLWMDKPAGEKKQAVVIHLVKVIDEAGIIARGIKFSTLESFWYDGTEIRINNMDDGKERPDSPTKINERVNRGFRESYKWNDSYFFVHWCRYGNPNPIKESMRKKEVCNAAARWGSVSASTGALLYFSKHQKP